MAAFSLTSDYESDIDSEKPIIEIETNIPQESLDYDALNTEDSAIINPDSSAEEQVGEDSRIEVIITPDSLAEAQVRGNSRIDIVFNPENSNPNSSPKEKVREDSRIEILWDEPDWEENEVGVYLSGLRAYLVELVLQGDIHEQVLDFTCELSPGSQLHVRINDAFDALGHVWTGNTREIDGEIQRELNQIRNASIVCFECNPRPDIVMACVVWNEIWWGE
jgi:uncharacterized protein YndB with AHSA1/START domain